MNSIIKNKKTIIIWAIVLILIAWWVWAYFHFSKKEDTDTNVALKDLTEEEICQDQYWINATNWDSWHCKCKEWFERNADWTKCVMIKEDDLLEETEDKGTTRLTLEQKRAKAATEKANNTFYGLENEKNDDTKLIPVKEWSEWKQFNEKKYNFNFEVEPDYRLEEWEELTIENNSKIQAISNKDEDYLSSIINDINNKKKNWWTTKSTSTTNTATKNTNTNNIDKSLPLVENFIGTLETKATNEGLLYQYTFTDPDFWTTPVRVSFLSKTVITNSDVVTDIWGNGININKLKFHWGISSVEVTKDFWISRCWPFEPEGYVFKPGKNTFSLKGYWEEWFVYINYFRGQIYPVFAFPWTELSQWNKYCMVEIGRKENFTKFPFELKWSFENGVVAVTKNKDSSSNCMSLLGNHDNIMVIYNEELACEVRWNNWTSLREISTK